MKILLATFFDVPHVGGVWNYMTNLKTQLESIGHQVDLLGSTQNGTAVHLVEQKKIFTSNDVKISGDYYSSRYFAYNKDPYVLHYERQRCRFKKQVGQMALKEYDLIHAQDAFSSAWIKEIIPPSKPLVTSLHGSVAEELKDYVLNIAKSPNPNYACSYFNLIEFEGATSGKKTITANHWMKNLLINEYKVPANQIIVCNYGYDIEGFKLKMINSNGITKPLNKKVILFTGRLVDVKGVHHLLSALSKLSVIRKDFVCWIVGDGNNKNSLIEQAAKLGLNKIVTFFGERNDVPHLLSLADVFVLPSLIDNQPLSLIEAQIAGKACIASDAGGIPEMILHNKTGIITPKGNQEALFINLNKLLDNEEFRKNLGNNAMSWATDNWSQKKALNSLLQVYRQVL
ncbi:glycosyltransferase family 4 protein [Rossellomorea sp. KS-H15a]|uniref:glycosyltransferase family 4 protein n=1 Tax=Rossellomorea sp. KS-H15a TaxID=2963940 RepID=UPI0020C5CA90|nr:glycosyltransferase family 4 protein [Rossellomorea sp. KS-H15a]UTE75470.1 glycosyltransferase family 4 protein [Rossellomorea sp. KS-H15a]